MNNMKLLNKILAGLLVVALLLPVHKAFCQDTKKGRLSIAIGYFTDNNKIPYLVAKVKTKIDGRFKTIAGIPLKLFLNSDSAGNLIANVVTDDKGEASATIPASLKSRWGKMPGHSFAATFAGNDKFSEASGDLTVGKAKINIDTTSDRKITATVYAMADSVWKPVKGVDVIIAIKRMGGDLNVNETATFTTDSTGRASADFKRDSIYGDTSGNITLVAKVEDNDQFGNLSIEKTVPWGAKFVPVNTFGRRTLFATAGRAPIWLMLMASSIIITVWGILIALVINVFRIKKLGEEVEGTKTLA